MIPIYKPYLKNYKKSAIDAIDSEWISNHGKYVNMSEKRLSEIIGCKYVILMNNGTSATNCLFISLKYMYPNINKIYVPNNVFVAPWNCALNSYNKSQIEVMRMLPSTLNIDVSESYIKSLDTNSAIVIVHNYGNIINVVRLKEIRPDIIFIEDNCEGFLGKYNDKYTGSCNLVKTSLDSGTDPLLGGEIILSSSISFYGNKTLTTGEGGAFLTNNIDVYNYIRKVYSHGMTNERYKHDILAYNYRMTNVCAAILYDQLCDYKKILNRKKEIYELYTENLSEYIETDRIKITKQEEETERSYWMFYILIPEIDYTELEKYMLKNNIEIRPFFYSIKHHKHLSEISSPHENNFSLNITKHGVFLPSYPELENNNIIKISKVLKEYIGYYEHISYNNKPSLYKLCNFIKNIGGDIKDKYFTYFDKRPIEVIKNHLVTIIYKNIGYGHIDKDTDTRTEGVYWLGVYVLPEHQNKGNGTIIVKYLINYFRYHILYSFTGNKLNEPKLYLTVHKDNISAVSIYRKYNFEIVPGVEGINDSSSYKMLYVPRFP